LERFLSVLSDSLENAEGKPDNLQQPTRKKPSGQEPRDIFHKSMSAESHLAVRPYGAESLPTEALKGLESEAITMAGESRTTSKVGRAQTKPLYTWQSTLALEGSMTEFLNETKLKRMEDYGDDHDGSLRSRCAGKLANVLAPVVCSEWFDICVTAAIVSNAIYIGVATDHLAKNLLTTNPDHFDVIEMVFLAIFVFELSLRFGVRGFDLFRSKSLHGVDTTDRSWNIFDFTVIGLQVLELLFRQAKLDVTVHRRVSILRILRLLRLLRIMRLVKAAHWVSDLRMIVYSIRHSLSLFFWSICSLVMVIYMFAIYFSLSCSRPKERSERAIRF
jgi:hypothetical protein